MISAKNLSKLGRETQALDEIAAMVNTFILAPWDSEQSSQWTHVHKKLWDSHFVLF